MAQKPTAWSNYAEKQEPTITIHAEKRRWEVVATLNFNGIKCEARAYCLSSGHGQLPSAEDYEKAVTAAKRDCQRVLAAHLMSIYTDVLEIRQFYEPLPDIFNLDK